jgi:hypothetical protein
MSVHVRSARGRDQIRTQEQDCRAWGGAVGWVDMCMVLSLHARVSNHVSGPQLVPAPALRATDAS